MSLIENPRRFAKWFGIIIAIVNIVLITVFDIVMIVLYGPQATISVSIGVEVILEQLFRQRDKEA